VQLKSRRAAVGEGGAAVGAAVPAAVGLRVVGVVGVGAGTIEVSRE